MVQLKVQNIKGVTDAIKMYGKDAEKEIGNVTKINAQEIEGNAKRFAPIDDSFLRNSIRSEQQENKLSYKITAYMPYSAFQEFGTGALVNIQEGWGAMASLFKGKGIKQVNIKPHPFMYPAFVIGRKQYAKDIKDALKSLNKRFNNG